MNKTILLLTLVLFSGIAKSQVFDLNGNYKTDLYKPFPTSADKPVWIKKTVFFGKDDTYDYMGMIGDTLIESKKYSKIYALNSSTIESSNISHYVGALREEFKKIFYVHDGSQTETQRFDFSAEIGDTVSYHEVYIPHEIDTIPGEFVMEPIIIKSIDTIIINDENRLIYSVSCGDSWIEGIGSIEWGNLTSCGPWVIPGSLISVGLSCFKLNGVSIYGECDMHTGVSKISNAETIHIYPNPITDYSILSLPNNIIKEVSVHDLKGSLIHKAYVHASTYSLGKINVKPGLYLIIVKADNGTIYRQKFVKAQ